MALNCNNHAAHEAGSVLPAFQNPKQTLIVHTQRDFVMSALLLWVC